MRRLKGMDVIEETISTEAIDNGTEGEATGLRWVAVAVVHGDN